MGRGYQHRGAVVTDSGRVPPGPVTHFKGGRYVVLGTALHTETGEYLTVYRTAEPMPADADCDFFARPEAMFSETVIHDGYPVPRFDSAQQRSVERPDILAATEDLLSEQSFHPARMIAVRSLLDAQRNQAVALLSDVQAEDTEGLAEAVMGMLGLLDAAEREVAAAEQRRPQD
jgi:hypothetical protein